MRISPTTDIQAKYRLPGGRRVARTSRLTSAQVTVPGVGTVTVDQPDLPGETPLTPQLNGPTLPDAGDLLPQTPTVTLPLP